MFKRLAAISLALIFAAQLLAGVCVCFDGEKDDHAKMSCCKSEKKDQPSLSAVMNCCGSKVCGEPTGSSAPGLTAFSPVQISAPVVSAVEKLIASLKPRPNFALKISTSKRAGDVPKLFDKPPDFYLHNHAFLI